MNSWTPAEVIDAARLAIDGLHMTGTIVLIVIVLFMNKNLNGRMSQIIDLVGRFSGKPDARTHDEPVETERRSKNK